MIDSLRQEKMVAVDGWHFRFPDLFLKHKHEIKEMFTFRKGVTTRIDKLLSVCPADTYIKLAVHIRRVDYCRGTGWQDFFDDDDYIN